MPAIGATLLPLPVSLGRLETEDAIERSGAKLVIGEDDDARHRRRARRRPVRRARPGPRRPDRADLRDHRPLEARLADRAPQAAHLRGLHQPPAASAPSDRMLPLSPITQGAGEMCLYALRTGAALVMSHHSRFDAERSLALAERTSATVLGGVPDHGRPHAALARARRHRPLHLRATISAGAPLPESVAREWEERTGAPTCSFYGAMDVGQLAVPSPDDPAEKRWTTVGRPHDTRRAADLRPRRQRGRAGRGGRDLHARAARAAAILGRGRDARTPTTAGRTSATSAGSTRTASCTSRGA